MSQTEFSLLVCSSLPFTLFTCLSCYIPAFVNLEQRGSCSHVDPRPFHCFGKLDTPRPFLKWCRSLSLLLQLQGSEERNTCSIRTFSFLSRDHAAGNSISRSPQWPASLPETRNIDWHAMMHLYFRKLRRNVKKKDFVFSSPSQHIKGSKFVCATQVILQLELT